MKTRLLKIFGIAMIWSNLAFPVERNFTPLIYAVKADLHMTLDGLNKEECYRQAQQTTPFLTMNGTTLAYPQTRVIVAYDDRQLYCFFDCQESIEYGPVKDDDSIEWFISGTEDTPTHYYQIYLPVKGNHTLNYGQTKADDQLQHKVKTKVIRHPHGYQAELFLDRSLFPQADDILWRVNFNRTRTGCALGKQQKFTYTCWSPTGNTFHAPNNFGYMILGEQQIFMKTYYRKRAEAIISVSEELVRRHPAIVTVKQQMDTKLTHFLDRLKSNAASLQEGEKLLKQLQDLQDEMILMLIKAHFYQR